MYDLEQAIRSMKESKAPGLDSIGAELLRSNTMEMAQKLYTLLLKMITRGQWPSELAGGWILPLFKGHGHHSLMSGYRAILLARCYSKTWRKQLEDGVRQVAHPNQWGGRRGLSRESLHLQLRLWQSNAKHQRQSLAIIFMDIRQAFYSLAKPLLTNFRGDKQDIQLLGRVLNIPASAVDNFERNVRTSNLVEKATQSRLATAMTEATLSKTWFIVDDTVQAPSTGSRPGGPMADQFFSLTMSAILEQVYARMEEADLVDQDAEDPVHNSVVWVDDAAFAIRGNATDIAQKTTRALTILFEVFQEFGLQLAVGTNKTAVMISWHGPKSIASRQHCDKNSAHTALAVKACLLGCNSATLNAQVTFVYIAVAISALAGGGH